MYFTANANPDIPQKQQMKAIGFAEGKLFYQSIANHNLNVKEFFLNAFVDSASDYPPSVYQYFIDNLKWTRQQSLKNFDSFWQQVAFTMAHFDGLVQGYQQSSNESAFLSELEMFMYVSTGEFFDILSFAMPEMRQKLMKQELNGLNDHCSALVRMIGDEIYVSHNSWFAYSAMNRVKKQYNFDLNAAAKRVIFSSYPGFSYSMDDWYQTDSGFMAFETTNDNYNPRTYDLSSPQSLLSWIRVQVALRLAESGEDFVTQISKQNSGTYNNQWVAVDLKKWEKNSNTDVIWVTELMPGVSASYDATQRLYNAGYFPSYNIPSQVEIFKAYGYPQTPHSDINPINSYNTSARARIFQRDAPKTENLTDIQHLMLENNYLTDNLSCDKNPICAIASRFDLLPIPQCSGAIDCKVGMYNRQSKEYANWFISGPTRQNLPSFSFQRDENMFCSRRGLPNGPYEYEWDEGEAPKGW